MNYGQACKSVTDFTARLITSLLVVFTALWPMKSNGKTSGKAWNRRDAQSREMTLTLRIHF
jgi:hypothetical protein